MKPIDHIKSSFVDVVSYALNFPFIGSFSRRRRRSKRIETEKYIIACDGMIESQTPINALSHIILSNRAYIEIL